MNNRTNRRTAVLLAGLLGLGISLAGGIDPAGADIDDLGTCVPADVDDHHCDTPEPDPEPNFDPADDFSTCVDLDEEGHAQCDHPDGGDEGTGDPEVDGGSEPLPPAPVGDVVVADPTFTG